MATVTQDFFATGFHSPNTMFSTTDRDLLSNSEFLNTLGAPATNSQSAERQQSRRVSRPASAIGSYNQDNAFFEFDPQNNTNSPLHDQFTTSIATSIADWPTDMAFAPISPPNSAPFSPKEWPLDFPANATQGNILTIALPGDTFANIPSEASREQYGQVTPPDEDDEDTDSLLDDQLREQSRQQQQSQQHKQSTAALRRRKQINTSTQQSTAPTNSPKRTRKYAARTSISNTSDPSNPTDIRRSKFLERNRVAASKCRQKKKEWTQNLETRARELQKNNGNLRMMLESLREEVVFLKGECKRHVGCECREIQRFMEDAATRGDLYEARDYFKSEPLSPIGPAPDSHDGSVGSSSRHGSIDASASTKEELEDENALEALLTSSLNQDTSDEGIKTRVGG